MKVSEIRRLELQLKTNAAILQNIIGYANDDTVNEIKIDYETEQRLADMVETMDAAYDIIETLFNKMEI